MNLNLKVKHALRKWRGEDLDCAIRVCNSICRMGMVQLRCMWWYSISVRHSVLQCQHIWPLH